MRPKLVIKPETTQKGHVGFNWNVILGSIDNSPRLGKYLSVGIVSKSMEVAYGALLM